MSRVSKSRRTTSTANLLARRSFSRRGSLAAVAISVTGGALAYSMFVSLAAAPFTAVEGEQAVVAGGARVVSDGGASNQKLIQFSNSTTPTPMPTPTPTPAPTPKPAAPVPTKAPVAAPGSLSDPAKKDIAFQLVSSAENSSTNWRAQFSYIEYNVEGNSSENRGYTAGLVGFTSRTHDMLELVELYARTAPGNLLQKYLPALRSVDGSSSKDGLGAGYEQDWRTAARDGKFQQAQLSEVDRVYFNPAVNQAKADGVKTLGQFMYYDAIVMHGEGTDAASFGSIRANALRKAKSPAQGGNETTYLNAFLDARKAAMLTEAGHSDTTRVDTMQRKFLREGNLTLTPPLSWSVYGDPFTIR